MAFQLVAVDFDTETGNLLQTRPAFGGNIMATIICPDHRPQMATVRSNVFKKTRVSDNEEGERIEFKADLSGVPERMRRLESVHRQEPADRGQAVAPEPKARCQGGASPALPGYAGTCPTSRFRETRIDPV